jgi:hypothetical protein
MKDVSPPLRSVVRALPAPNNHEMKGKMMKIMRVEYLIDAGGFSGT